MSIFVDISAALDKHLNDMPGVPDVAWENKKFTPKLDALYLRPTLLPADTIQAALGDNGTDENKGIYQVDIFAKAGTGKKESIDMADLIANRFKRGTYLTYNDRVIRIKNVSRRVGANTDGWYMIPIEINYIAHTEARV